jgi:parallel beta-helix repeat protein
MSLPHLATVATLLLAVLPGIIVGAELRVPVDFNTIQSAIDAAKSGDTVLVAAGTYRERLTMKPGTTLRSAGDDSKGKLGLKRAETTIIDGGGIDGSGAGVDMADDSMFDGFTVQNVGVYDDVEWKRHFDTHGEQQSYEHIGEPGVAGIAAIGVNCTISNNIVRHVGYSGIGIMGVDGKRVSPLVIHNYCYRNMGGGIGAMRGNTATIQSNVCFENFYAGIGHDNASPLVIDNECYGNVRAGIGVSEGSCPIVRGNKCHKNQRAGIGIRTGSETRPIVEDNDCYGNGYAGIGVREEAAPIIRDNRCYKNKLAGIGSRTGATPVIVDNECYENDKAGIGQMSGTRTVLMGNYLHHNKTSGIGFDAGGGGESLVMNNRVIDNALVAAGVNPGWKVLFTGNEFSREGGLPPIVMVFEGATATFSKNVIRGGGVAGIRVAGTIHAEDNHFDGTSFRTAGPPNFAIWGLKGARVTMAGNRINGWRHALSSSEGHVTAVSNFVRRASKAAFMISKPASPPIVKGNSLESSNRTDVVALLDGEPLAAGENHVGALTDESNSDSDVGATKSGSPTVRGPGGPPPGG